MLSRLLRHCFYLLSIASVSTNRRNLHVHVSDQYVAFVAPECSDSAMNAHDRFDLHTFSAERSHIPTTRSSPRPRGHDIALGECLWASRAPRCTRRRSSSACGARRYEQSVVIFVGPAHLDEPDVQLYGLAAARSCVRGRLYSSPWCSCALSVLGYVLPILVPTGSAPSSVLSLYSPRHCCVDFHSEFDWIMIFERATCSSSH